MYFFFHFFFVYTEILLSSEFWQDELTLYDLFLALNVKNYKSLAPFLIFFKEFNKPISILIEFFAQNPICINRSMHTSCPTASK